MNDFSKFSLVFAYVNSYGITFFADAFLPYMDILLPHCKSALKDRCLQCGIDDLYVCKQKILLSIYEQMSKCLVNVLFCNLELFKLLSFF